MEAAVWGRGRYRHGLQPDLDISASTIQRPIVRK